MAGDGAEVTAREGGGKCNEKEMEKEKNQDPKATDPKATTDPKKTDPKETEVNTFRRLREQWARMPLPEGISDRLMPDW